MSGSAREHILEVAGNLFFQHGYRAIGIDMIIAEADVAKATLYRHFPSKDALIVAYLREANTRFWAWFEGALAAHPDNPRQQIVEVYRRLQTLVTTPVCWGCPFLIAATEFSDREHPGHQVALEHKQALQARLVGLCRAAGLAPPETFASQLYLLMDGAFMAVRVFGVHNPAAHIAEAVERLIACADVI